jgi:glycosyltransferase involved in cell wall biosynthesis
MTVRVVHLITDLSTGGSQTALARLVSRIDRARFEPSVICLKNGDTPLAGAIRSMDVPVADLELTSPARLGGLVRLYRLLDDARPAIVHAWLFHAVFAARVLARMTGVPVVISARRNINLGSPLRELLNRWTAGLDDRVVAVSEAARGIEIARGGAPPEKVIVIPNGVDPASSIRSNASARSEVREALGVPPDSRLVATAGRLHPAKGIDCFLRASAIVSETRPHARFLVVGDGPDRAALERLSQDLGIRAKTLFLGERTDLSSLLAGIDLFVLASREEGMPNVVLEAMAAGLPVVATAAGGTAEIIENGTSGFLVPPGETAGIAAAAGKLLDDPSAASQIAAAALRRVAESFSIETTVRRTQDLYEELLRQKLPL